MPTASLEPVAATLSRPGDFMREVERSLPALRAYARQLTRSEADRDDLVQETLARAWAFRRQFRIGTNFRAWLIRIERNLFLTGRRRAKWHAEFDPDTADRLLVDLPVQGEALHFADLERALVALPPSLREAFVAQAGGDDYDTIAARLRIPPGTLRSRVHRARQALLSTLDGDAVVHGPAPSRTPDPVPPPPARPTYQAWKSSGKRLIG